MKPTILSIGNATKDNFLDIQNQKIYKDELNDFHYDLTFDDSTLNYQKQAGVYGGTILSEKIFAAAHFKAFSSANPNGTSHFEYDEINNNLIDRFIVSHKGKSFILTSNPRSTKWVSPAFPPDLIYIADANFSQNYLADFKKYLCENPKIELVFNIADLEPELAHEFFIRANLVFVDFRKQNLSDLIDYSSYENAIDSLIRTGVRGIVIFDGSKIVSGNKEKIASIETNFELNSFYQNNIFQAAFVAENFSNSSKLEENLQVSVTIANKSDFNDILKPFYAHQILNRKNYELPVDVLSNTPDIETRLRKTAAKLVTRPKGIFAADESGGNIHKKFETIGLEDTFENRRAYREMFFKTPDIENYLSGIILFEETTGQNTSEGINFVEYLKNRGILVGVKLDGGLQPLTGFEGETISLGLDSLVEKLQKYSKAGIDFAKWRVAFEIDEEKGTPSEAAIASNLRVLAQYAKACQNYGIVPIVEPEVVYSGKHTIKQCREVTEKILKKLFEELKIFKVDLKGTILKTNMVLAGSENDIQSSSREVARETVSIFKKIVPKELAGIVFLSGGQTATQATDNLQEITNLGPFDWGLTYSYARALQIPALQAWAGKAENVSQAQLLFLERVAANSHALYKN